MSEAINKSTDTGVPKPSVLRQLIAVRPIDPAPEGKSRLKRGLRARAFIAIGVGATMGSGIFVLTGTVAANEAGPAITLSLLVAAFGGGLAALCYSEFAAFLPVPGSAYSYTYATLGEALAWFIGWNLLLEYAISASAVAVSWSAYVVSLLADAHLQDRKSTRLNSSHSQISYAVFCLRKKTRLNSIHSQISYAVFCLKKNNNLIPYLSRTYDPARDQTILPQRARIAACYCALAHTSQL